MRVPVHVPKGNPEGDPRELASAALRLIGEIHQVVFAPSGKHVVGYLVRRPDVGGMLRREDVFVALDSCVANDAGLVVTDKDGLDDAARERLQLDWDNCVLWCGMDARTSDGKELGWVSDVEFYPKSGKVSKFYIGDGAVAQSLVGNVVIPGELLRGYKDGYMVVDSEAAHLELDGGLAAKAGEGYARAKYEGKQAAEKAAHGLGSMLGKAKKKSKKHVGRTKGMFGAFMDEYKKASK